MHTLTAALERATQGHALAQRRYEAWMTTRNRLMLEAWASLADDARFHLRMSEAMPGHPVLIHWRQHAPGNA
jgi:hypothetical protein